MERLLEIIKKLRAPDGCPWDKKQTHKSLKRFMIEEVYEVLDSIDEGNDEHLKEELGDLLLQILLHAQIASERGAFSFKELADYLADKLVQRHPHVFAKATAKTAEEVEKQWEKQKKRESLLDGLPRSMPPILQIYRISERVSRVGFDWKNIDDILDKVYSELGELRSAIDKYKKNSKFIDEVNDELGDLIFSSVQIARYLKQPINEIMSASIDKFIRRFKRLETIIKSNNKLIEELSLEELNTVWNKVKEEGL